MLQKLLNKAKEVEKVDISPENLTEIDLEGIYEAKGKLFFDGGAIYRQISENPPEWLKTGISPENEGELGERVEKLENWAISLKKALDNKFEEISQVQDETIKVLKEYIDTKVEVKNKKKKK